MCQAQVQLVQLGQLHLHQFVMMLRHTIVDSLLSQSASCIHFLLNYYFLLGGWQEKFKIKAKLSPAEAEALLAWLSLAIK